LEKLLPAAVVMERTRKSRSPMYADIARGTFPAPIKVGPRAVAWVESEISAYIKHLIAASRGGSADGAL
jgi:prophage regulatory protein